MLLKKILFLEKKSRQNFERKAVSFAERERLSFLLSASARKLIARPSMKFTPAAFFIISPIANFFPFNM